MLVLQEKLKWASLRSIHKSADNIVHISHSFIYFFIKNNWQVLHSMTGSRGVLNLEVI